MPLETVQITVEDDEVVPGLVDGVVVRFFDVTGTTLITEGTTGAVDPGITEVTLNGDDPPIRYQLRFYLNGGSILSPQLIDVYSPPASAPTGANNFLITASLFTLPTSPNPRLCRVSGYMWDPSGRPKPGVDVAFIPCFSPLVVDGIGIMGERVHARSDAEGFIQIDLLRQGFYLAVVEGHDNVPREIAVPDRSSVNVMHLLFPIVVDVAYDPPGPFGLAVGADLVLTPTVTASDFRVLDGAAPDDVRYETDNPAVASVSVGQDSITVHGHAAGSTILRASRRDETLRYIPDPGVNGDEVIVTVT